MSGCVHITNKAIGLARDRKVYLGMFNVGTGGLLPREGVYYRMGMVAESCHYCGSCLHIGRYLDALLLDNVREYETLLALSCKVCFCFGC
jgi:hypothetical protein